MSESDALRLLDEARACQHKPDRVIELCTRLLRESSGTGPAASHGHALMLLGGALRSKGQSHSAENYLHQAYSCAELLDDHALLAASASQIALVHMERRHLNVARGYLQTARENYIKSGSRQGEARTLYNHACTLLLEERNEEAMGLLEEAMQAYSEVQSTIGITHVMNTMGVLQLKLGKYEDALDQMTRCRQLFNSLEQTKYELTVELNIAECYIKMGNYPSARASLRSSMSRAAGQGFHMIECRAALYLSRLFQLEHDIEDAAKYYHIAREISIQNGFADRFNGLAKECELDDEVHLVVKM
jgi:tetratricopeptide (TPR) repeat protein